MIYLKTVCDTRRMKQDGTYPLVFRISLNGKSRDIASGISCSKSHWDDRKSMIKEIDDEMIVLAKRLQDKRIELLEKIRDFEYKNPSVLDVQQVKEALLSKGDKRTVEDFWLSEIERLKQNNAHGSARNYASSLLGIKKQVNLNVSFPRIDYKWLTDLETRFKLAGLKINSISSYMRSLRSIYNKAINLGIVGVESYPFRRYKVKSESTAPRSISIEELRAFFNHTPAVDSYEYKSWCYGRLIFLLRGINFADLAVLSKDNVKDGRIIYKRQKTGKIYSVKLLPESLNIIDELSSDDRQLLFPILSDGDLKKKALLPKIVGQKRKVCNKWLKKIGEQLEIEERLSTYVFRYSHANACKKLGYSKDLISESLGHGYGTAVTSAYLEGYDVELIDEMNQKVCNEIIEVVN